VAASGNANSGAAGVSGSVSVGGKGFNLSSEQAAVLLQQPFEALSKTSSDPSKVLEHIQAKGKGDVMLESVEDA
jgi:hypothetical protein